MLREQPLDDLHDPITRLLEVDSGVLHARNLPRTTRDDRDRSAVLERLSATEHRDDRAAYTEAESEFIAAIVGRATRLG
jgi:GrpB-like predicted nucleotidyltransferase (UPF0157 family)